MRNYGYENHSLILFLYISIFLKKERVYRDKQSLDELPEDRRDIFQHNMLDSYINRPDIFQHNMLDSYINRPDHSFQYGKFVYMDSLCFGNR